MVEFLPAGKRQTSTIGDRWLAGVYLGVVEKSSELIIGFGEKIVKARCVRRRTMSERANSEALLKIQGLPWRPVPGQVEDGQIPAVIAAHAELPEGTLPPEAAPAVPEARDVYLRRGIELKKYGYTENCPGCKAAREGRTARTHSNACRDRIKRAMENDPSMAGRITEANLRRGGAGAEAGSSADAQPAVTAPAGPAPSRMEVEGAPPPPAPHPERAVRRKPTAPQVQQQRAVKQEPT